MINGAKKIIEILNKEGYEAYMVGGCVRDIIMNNIPYDYDITTSASPEKIIEIFPHTIPTGIKHGTVTVIYDNFQYEVTTYRIDGKYEDNRRPLSVTFSDKLIEDIKRRDFTINSIAYNEKDGFIDYFNGREDIKNKMIRTVNNPDERFNEDALRILRGIRFSSRFDFKIEESTYKSIKTLMYLVKNISGERIFEELNKMFSASPYKATQLLYETGFFKTFNIDINPDIINSLKNINEKNFITVFSVINHKNSEYKKFLQILKCSNTIKKSIEKIFNSFNYPISNKEDIKTMLYELKCDDIIDYIFEVQNAVGKNVCKAKTLYREIIKNKECYSLKTLEIDGNDLIKSGIEKNEIRSFLDRILRAVIKDNSLNQKEILLNLLKKGV